MKKKDADLIELIRKHWRECVDNDSAERQNRLRGRDAARFAAGEQWDPTIVAERAAQVPPRPCLTVDKMGPSLHQVENEVRRNEIAIRISPMDTKIDKDMAEVDQGLVRHIQYDSTAQSAYHMALVDACRSGLGAFKLVTEYEAEDSFHQDVKIKPIEDAIGKLFFDPFTKEIDKSDSRYMFEIEVLSHDQYKDDFGETEVAASNFFDGNYEHTDGWITKDAVRIAKYWYVERTERTLLELDTGQTVWKDNLPDDMLDGVKILREDKREVKRARCVRTNGHEIIDEIYDWPDSTIPIFIVVGEELVVDGERRRYPLVWRAMDAQRLLNFCVTSMAELASLAPKNPWIGAEGQFEGHEGEWQTANLVNRAYMEYKATTIAGEAVPPPFKTPFEPQIQALSLLARLAEDYIKATLGIFDASLGARSNETSGIAIQRRQAEGDLSNYHFTDNLKRQIGSCGRSIVRVKPTFYDAARTIRILGDEQKERVVRINQPYVDESGKQVHYDMSADKYHVTVTTGPSFESMRQEAWANLTSLTSAWPQLMQIAGDLIFRNSDIPGADDIADRLEKALPPELQSDKAASDIPPKVAAQLQALTQQNKTLTDALNTATQDAAARRMETESRERIEAMKAQVQLIIAQSKISSQEAMVNLGHELETITKRLDLLNSAVPVEQPVQQRPAA